ncbi:MAG: copper transporter, partial [Actinomycetota bacterium]|nr:copper transporter [Actinomycetota bacterium]
MVNLRYHIISIVAVFLALGVGVVMGSAVIDRAVVGTLREQQAAIDRRIDDVLRENGELQARLAEQQQTSEQLADEGSQRLLAGQLTGVPVVVVAVEGADSTSTALDDVLQALRTADADYEGTVQLTERLALTSEEERRDLARALGTPDERPVDELRALVIDRLAGALVPVAAVDGDAVALPAAGQGLAELRAAGFVEYEPPEGGTVEISDLAAAKSTVVLVSEAGAALEYDDWARQLVGALTADRDRDGRPDVRLLAVEALGPPGGDGEDETGFTEALRADDALSARLSTVNNVDT